MVSPSETRYCLPPVAITAYIDELLERRSLPLSRYVSTLFRLLDHVRQHRAHDPGELDAHPLFGAGRAQPDHPATYINRWVFGGKGDLEVDLGADVQGFGRPDEQAARREVGDQVSLQVTLRG